MRERTRQRPGDVSGRVPRHVTAAVLAVCAVVASGVAPAAAGAAGAQTVITVTRNRTWGRILTLSNGDTLYRLTADHVDRSVCTGACAAVWPPVVLASGQTHPVGRGVKGLGTITRPGGARQVTIDGEPLYLFAGDQRAGQVSGNIKDTWGQWWVVDPAHPRQVPTAAVSGHPSSGGGSAPASGGTGVAY